MNESSEVEALCSALIRIDTSNPARAERPAAEYVATLLAEAGVEPVLLEAEPGRTNVVARIAGTNPARPALLVHGHLDVVPADAADWSVPPFSGEVDDEFVWGRGAVDMKGMDAMVLAVVRSWSRAGFRPSGTSSSRSWLTRKPAAGSGPTGWSISTRTCSRAAPRRSARSADSATRSASPSGCTRS